MMFLVILALLGSVSSIIDEEFLSVEANSDEDYGDLEEALNLDSREKDSETIPIEITMVETEELVDVGEDDDDVDKGEDEEDLDVDDLPDKLNLKDLGVIHDSIYQGRCGSCGWISGTQTLEARLALVSENYVPMSVQNFMNCANKVCVGTQPYAVTTQARKSDFIVPENELPYIQNKCKKEGTCTLCGKDSPQSFTNVLDEQFVVIGGTRAARSESQVMKALQSGPVTTCFIRAGKSCKPGCSHANSIIGYNETSFFIQESYGPGWGRFKDGSWPTNKGSNCSKALIKKAFYPVIFYDYDRANAYFSEITVSVPELKFVDKDVYGITKEDTKNVGKAKNKCAFLGSACRGVVYLSSSEAYGLISSELGECTEGCQKGQKAFKKHQMVVYLRHEETGKYIGIKNKRRKNLHMVSAEKAAPFFTSYSRFISFDYPTYHLVDNRLRKISGGIRDIDDMKTWTLNDCNLRNNHSGNSLDLVSKGSGRNQYYTFGGSLYNNASSSQRFDVGLSGMWILRSRMLGQVLGHVKKEFKFVDPGGKDSTTPLRWNARQILHQTMGKTLDPDMKLSNSNTDFNFDDLQNVITPTDCAISVGDDHLVVIKGKKIKMRSHMISKWTFVYKDL